MRVLILNQPFYPDPAATAQHCHDLAKHLIAQGHAVDVIASRSIYGQTGATLPARETVDGASVYRVGKSLFGKRGIVLRLIDFLLFYVAAGWRALRVERPDVVVVLTTPPFIALVALMLKALRGSKVVYWAMDLYPDVPVALGVMKPTGLATRFFEGLNRWCMRRSDRVVVLGRCMQRLVVSKGLAPQRVVHIGVWAANDPSQPAPQPNPYRSEWGLDGKFVVMYAGNLGLAHDAATLLDAAGRLRDRTDVRYVFVGGGKRLDEVKQRVDQEGWEHVQVHPYQPRERLDAMLAMPDVHLISQAAAFNGVVVPSKLYGIMAAGRASLMVGPSDCEVAMELADSQSGLRFDSGDDQGLADAIAKLADDHAEAEAMGRRAKQAAIEQHHPDKRCEAWCGLLLEVCGQADVVAPTSPRDAVETKDPASS